MNIALDYDGTASADPVIFKSIVKLLRDAGHKVYIVTMRFHSECFELQQTWGPLVDGIIPTARQAKRPVTDAAGIPIHVWIDDNPEAVTMSALQIWGSSSQEGTVVVVDHDKGTKVEEKVST